MDKHWAPYSKVDKIVITLVKSSSVGGNRQNMFHWLNDFKVCLPCNISYSAILRLETIQQVNMFMIWAAMGAL